MKRRKPSKMILMLLFLDLSAVAFHVQTIKATEGKVYIRADGSIDPSTAPISTQDNVTYTLTAPLSGSLVIQRDNVAVDGAGYGIRGAGSDNGTDLSGRRNVTLKNTEIENFAVGVLLSSSSGCTISGINATNNHYGIALMSSVDNTVSDNAVSGKYGTSNYYGIAIWDSSNNTVYANNSTNSVYGIWLTTSSDNNTVFANSVADNGIGIAVDYSSDNNTVSANSVTDNGAGIMIDYSSGNTFRNNTMVDNPGSFDVNGNDLPDFVNDVDSSNTVDGKPIYYWVNVHDAAVPSDAGCVVLANCTGIAIQDLNLSNSRKGILLAYTTNATIAQNNMTNYLNAIWLQHSTHNTISRNRIANGVFGVWLVLDSSYNTVSENEITNDTNTGIGSLDSSHENVYGNRVTNNEVGVGFDHTFDSTVSGNNSTDNSYGVQLNFCSGNTLSGNSVKDNGVGINLYLSSRNTLRNNTMVGNAFNFGVDGNHLSDFTNDVDASNTVDGKPIYYWVNVHDAAVPSDAGCVVLANCTGIAIQDLNVTKNRQGIQLAYTTNTTITQNVATSNEVGILLESSANNTVSANNVTNNGNGGGIWLIASDNTVSENSVTNNNGAAISLTGSHNTVTGNNITNNNGVGISIGESSDNSVSENDIVGCGVGVRLFVYSFNNSVIGNNITKNGNGISIDTASNNTIHHNNFFNNSVQVSTIDSVNLWDDGYPSGGNYWSDYNDTDSFNGLGQNEAGSDGIGDQPYQIDTNNADRYPLIAPYSTFDAGVWNGTDCSVAFTSNSTITDFQVNVAMGTISFNVTSESTFGFCRVTVPNVIINELWHENYTVLLNGESVPFRSWNDTINTYIYLNYTESARQIAIVPELPSPLILMLFTTSTLAAISAKTKARAKPRTQPSHLLTRRRYGTASYMGNGNQAPLHLSYLKPFSPST